MPRFSLIVATFGRVAEFGDLLDSLAQQELCDYELIVVDQNPHDQLTPLLQAWQREVALVVAAPIAVRHLRCTPGVSKARNLGIQQSSGEILAFPDDDCWYFPDTLKRVDAWFRQHPDYGILSLGCRDHEGRISSNSWRRTECDVSHINAFRTTAALCYFVRRPETSIPLVFDETLGPGAGTTFGCGEDTDFVLSLMDKGIRARFDANLHIGHPCREGGFQDVDRARRYGGGFGRLLAKHRMPFLFAGFVAYDFVRAGAHTLFGNRSRGAQLCAHGKGIVQAYIQS